jgi:uncharacterized protein (UPF0335 family)
MSDGADPSRDFERMLDLDRSTLIRDFVDEMESRMREVESAQAALKDIAEAAVRQEFPPRDVAAMKKIARLRLKDQKAAAQQELEALGRIGKAADFDVLDFEAVR